MSWAGSTVIELTFCCIDELLEAYHDTKISELASIIGEPSIDAGGQGTKDVDCPATEVPPPFQVIVTESTEGFVIANSPDRPGVLKSCHSKAPLLDGHEVAPIPPSTLVRNSKRELVLVET